MRRWELLWHYVWALLDTTYFLFLWKYYRQSMALRGWRVWHSFNFNKKGFDPFGVFCTHQRAQKSQHWSVPGAHPNWSSWFPQAESHQSTTGTTRSSEGTYKEEPHQDSPKNLWIYNRHYGESWEKESFQDWPSGRQHLFHMCQDFQAPDGFKILSEVEDLGLRQQQRRTT